MTRDSEDHGDVGDAKPLVVVVQAALICIVALLLSAHFMRWGEIGPALTCIASLSLLFIRKRWVPTVLTIGLIGGGLLWIRSAIDLVQMRLSVDAPWLRLALILGAVAAATLLATLIFRTKTMRARFQAGGSTAASSAGAFLLTAALLSTVLIVVDRPMLLADRFVPGSGWLVVLGLSTYAAWLTEKLLDPVVQPLWRRRLWGLFSIVFFVQLFLGLLGIDEMLMTGMLHVPVPAVILAGPIYRGGGFFMVILFSVALLLIGPAWCSYLCYFGAMDSTMAHRRRRPRRLPRWAWKARIAIVILVVVTAFLFGAIGVSGTVAASVGVGFGVVGIALMVALSHRQGVMVHCTVYCPMSLIADLAGKVSPFRVRIGEACTDCGLCTKACRFDALRKADIKRRRPGLTCTLCGDCVGSCHEGQLGYRFAGLTPERARALFMTLVAALHAVFLGVARL